MSAVNWADPSVQPVPLFANTFGLVVSLITSDGYLVIVQRSRDVGSYQNVNNVAINETVQIEFDRDHRTNAPNLYNATIRGAQEELGIPLNRSDIIFLNFGANTRFSMWALYGFAHTTRNLEQLLWGRRTHAKDKWEGIKLYPLNFDVNTVMQFVKETGTDPGWSGGALVSVYYTLVYHFGRQVVEEAIDDYLW
jgi:hypothetical protein